MASGGALEGNDRSSFGRSAELGTRVTDSSSHAENAAFAWSPGADARSGDDPAPAEILVALNVDAAPEAVPWARREISSRLARAARPVRELVGDIKLLAGELLTNAVLHGEPPVRLRLVARGGSLRVEVADASQVAPLRTRNNSDTMTGRGMALVAAIAARWGTEVDRHGKVVWAEVDLAGTGEPEDEAELLPAGPAGRVPRETSSDDTRTSAPARLTKPDETDAAGETDPADAVDPAGGVSSRYHVILGDVATDLLLAAESHTDSLLREFTLAAVGTGAAQHTPVPPRLAQLIHRVTDRFGEARQAVRRQALAAAAAGEQITRLELSPPASTADVAEEYLAALDEADEYARQARMLTLASPPVYRAFRRWYISSLVSQLRAAASGQVATPPPSFEEYLRRQGGERALPPPGADADSS